MDDLKGDLDDVEITDRLDRAVSQGERAEQDEGQDEEQEGEVPADDEDQQPEDEVEGPDGKFNFPRKEFSEPPEQVDGTSTPEDDQYKPRRQCTPSLGSKQGDDPQSTSELGGSQILDTIFGAGDEESKAEDPEEFTTIQLEEPEVLLDGELEKLSPSLFGGWQKRTFILTQTHLRYWKPEQDTSKEPAQGVINFNQIKVEMEVVEEDLKITIALSGAQRKFELRATTEEDFAAWTEKLTQVIDASRGVGADLSVDESKYSIEFWKYDLIDESAFKEQAESGDLLLFRGQHLAGKLQRTFTAGSVDHVAMIVKLDFLSQMKGDQLFFLEADANRGVCLTGWDDLKIFNDRYTEIFYRRLRCKRDHFFKKRVQDFFDNVYGNEYKMNLTDLLMKQNSINVAGFVTAQVNQDLKNRSFFCSELIVKCYKYLGILNTEKSSNQFLPKDLSFHSDPPLVVEDWAKLEEDKLILFDLTDEEKEKRAEFHGS